MYDIGRKKGPKGKMQVSKRIGILVGSLRKASFTRKIAEEMKRQLPEGYEAVFVEIGHLPLFNQDFDDESRTPESYTAFRKEIEGFDAFILATPEYNRSVPAVLKNALDVASRPYGQSKWSGKPVAVLSVSPGAIGGFGANHHLRQVLAFLNMRPVQQPELYIGKADTLLDKEGKVNSQDTRQLLKSAADALISSI